MRESMEPLLRKYLPKNIKNFIRDALTKSYIDLNKSPNAAIILSGTPRSGTTWIGEVINYNYDYRYIFEAFHPAQVPLWQQGELPAYLSMNSENPYFDSVINNVLSGEIRYKWIDRNKRKGFYVYNKRLFKEVYANLLLKGIKARFPEIPIILLLRHPCPTVISQINIINEDPILDAIERCFNNQALIDEHIAFVMPEFQKAKTTFEKCVFYWCVQYYVPLKQFKEGEIHLAFYENFCQNPDAEIRKLFNFLERPYTDIIFNKMKIPSRTCWGADHAINTGNSLIESWRTKISDQQMEQTQHILSLFGLDKIYGQASMPDMEAAQTLLRNVKKIKSL